MTLTSVLLNGNQHWGYQGNISHLERKASKLSYSQDDIFRITTDDEAFGKLQKQLRKYGAVTNELLMQKLHYFVKNEKKQSRKKGGAPKRQSKNNNATLNLMKMHEEEQDSGGKAAKEAAKVATTTATDSSTPDSSPSQRHRSSSPLSVIHFPESKNDGKMLTNSSSHSSHSAATTATTISEATTTTPDSSPPPSPRTSSSSQHSVVQFLESKIMKATENFPSLPSSPQPTAEKGSSTNTKVATTNVSPSSSPTRSSPQSVVKFLESSIMKATESFPSLPSSATPQASMVKETAEVVSSSTRKNASKSSTDSSRKSRKKSIQKQPEMQFLQLPQKSSSRRNNAGDGSSPHSVAKKFFESTLLKATENLPSLPSVQSMDKTAKPETATTTTTAASNSTDSASSSRRKSKKHSVLASPPEKKSSQRGTSSSSQHSVAKFFETTMQKATESLPSLSSSSSQSSSCVAEETVDFVTKTTTADVNTKSVKYSSARSTSGGQANVKSLELPTKSGRRTTSPHSVVKFFESKILKATESLPPEPLSTK